MSGRGLRRRGEPLAALLAIVAGWVGARALLWQSPFPALLPPASSHAAAAPATVPQPVRAALWPARIGGFRPSAEADLPLAPWRDAPIADGAGVPPAPGSPLYGSARPAAHQALWLAAVARRSSAQPGWDEAVRSATAPEGMPWGVSEPAPGRAGHWSGDAWLFLRGSGARPRSSAFALPSYGASQAGAVLRYRFAPGSGHDPYAYLRAVRALGAAGESEVAAGLGARPLPSVPLIAQLELRADPAAAGARPRPAALVIAAPTPRSLPWGLEAQAYLQAGYVGGRQPTAFADGALKVDRELARFDLGRTSPRVRLGAGVWGGAQRGAARLDVGPSGTLDLAVGRIPARLSLDLRQRVAGDAEPGTGVALTISTGF